jgi:hypothetical protein
VNIAAETGKAVQGFFGVMKESPLSLALVVSNFLLIGFIFYSGTQRDDQRTRVTDLIVNWQRESDKLMASCVSAEIVKMMLDALSKKSSPSPNPLKLPLELPTPNWALPSPASIPLPRPRPNGE